MTLFLAICAIAWAIAAEMRISNHRSRSFRDREALKAHQDQIASLTSENEALKKSNVELLAKASSAKQEEDSLRNKLNEAIRRSMTLGTELEESKQNCTRSAELEQEARRKLEVEIKARKQAVADYMKLEAEFRSSVQYERSERARSADSASYVVVEGQRPESNQSIFPDASADYAVIDVETTGFSNDDEIVEIAIIKVNSEGSALERFETTIRSSRDSNVEALGKHRLNSEMLCRSPGFEEVSHAIANCLDGKIIVAHNLSFDLRFLANSFKKVEGLEIDLGRGIDTLYGGEASGKCKLEDLCKDHNIIYESHSAMGDAEALLSLLVCGVLKPPISGQELAAKVVGEMRLRDCELRPRSMLPAKTSNIDTASVSDQDPTHNPIFVTGFMKGPLITLEAGNKVCCSCSSRNSIYREKLYAKHEALGLASPSSISNDHKCIVVEDLSSTRDKVRDAKRRKLPLVRAEDFIKYVEGGSLQTWLVSSDP